MQGVAHAANLLGWQENEVTVRKRMSYNGAMSKNSALRIALVSHNIVRGDGQGRANLEVVRYAQKQGAKVTLFADRVDSDLEAEGIEWVKVQPPTRSNWLVHNTQSLVMANRLLEKRRNDFDIIHACGATLTIPHHINTSQYVHKAWLQSPLHPSRVDRTPYGLYQWTYSTWNAYLERQAYHRAQFVVPASSTVFNELHQLVSVPKDKMQVILNGADPTEFFPPTQKSAEDRKALGLPETGVLGLFAGDIRINRKGIDTVLKALISVPNMQLIVVGKTEGSPFPAMAESLGVAGRTHFLDFRRDMAKIMRACDFFVFPSRYEACALVLVEALTSGLPIITAATTGGSEVVTPECGICVPDVEDVSAIANAMQKLVDNPALRQQFSQVAAQESDKYHWDKIAQQYYTLYTRIA
jgi:glycosyltransferase involved in cell wall biosynthesis